MLDLDTRRAVFQLKTLGHGVRAIARTLRISRNSVRSVLALGTPEVPSIEREQICAAHLDSLRALYADCQGNRVRVWEEAQKLGVAISYPALTAFLRREGVGVKRKEPAGRYHFEPGEEMQHDTSPHDVKGAAPKVTCKPIGSQASVPAAPSCGKYIQWHTLTP